MDQGLLSQFTINCKYSKIVKNELKNYKMDNELITKNWWNKNQKWFLPITGLLLVCIFLVIPNAKGLTDFAQTYADSEICQNAINEANKNEKVIKSLGKLQPIDKLAIMEGNSVYSNANKNIEITVRVSGKKGKARMDISAEKIGKKWEYKRIKIRIKETQQEIQVLKNI